jgi:hypothetical protein
MMHRATQRFRRARFRSKLLRRPLVRARHRGLREGDAFLASYPRSGTTWLRFLLYEALTGEESEFGSIWRAVPSLDKRDGARPVLRGGGRLLQTHETFCDGDRLVIYVVRDPRQVALSEYYWQRRNGTYAGTLTAFVRDYCQGRSNPWGAWGDHVHYWRVSEPARNSHLLVVRYEELRADTFQTLGRVLDFLGARPDTDLVRRAVTNNSRAGMQAKEDAARERGWRVAARADLRFVNTGPEGYREQLTGEQTEAIERAFAPEMAPLGYLATARP